MAAIAALDGREGCGLSGIGVARTCLDDQAVHTAVACAAIAEFIAPGDGQACLCRIAQERVTRRVVEDERNGAQACGRDGERCEDDRAARERLLQGFQMAIHGKFLGGWPWAPRRGSRGQKFEC